MKIPMKTTTWTGGGMKTAGLVFEGFRLLGQPACSRTGFTLLVTVRWRGGACFGDNSFRQFLARFQLKSLDHRSRPASGEYLALMPSCWKRHFDVGLAVRFAVNNDGAAGRFCIDTKEAPLRVLDVGQNPLILSRRNGYGFCPLRAIRFGDSNRIGAGRQ